MAHLGSTRYDSAARQLERTAARTAAGARGVVGLVAAVAAALGAAPPVSAAWLAPALAVELGWTALFLWRMWRGTRLPAWLVARATWRSPWRSAWRSVTWWQGRRWLGGASWVAGLVTMTIIVPAVVWRPAAAVPTGLVVAVAYLAGMRLADPGQDVTVSLGIHLVQVLAIAVLMTLLRRSAASADGFLRESARADVALMVERLRREDELKQVGSVHETSLHTLTMVGLGTYDGPSATLREQASHDLSALDRLRDTPGREGVPIALDALLDEVAGRATGLRVRRRLTHETVPGEVAESFARAVAEALSNVARHAGVREAELTSRRSGGEIRVEVADHGRGFDHDRLPPDRFGVRGSILDTMRALPNGGADITSGGDGTRVTLWWRP
ncbi:sensor histidine kinase [Nonomuraea ferruginea]